jgi:hypothetical protein
MKPVEFVMWLAGAMEACGAESPPSPEAWRRMYDKMGEAMGYIGMMKILEKAEKSVYDDEKRQMELDLSKPYYGTTTGTGTGASSGQWTTTTAGTGTGASSGQWTTTTAGNPSSSTLSLSSELLSSLNQS